MPGVWEYHFGFAKELTGRPIVLGEMGGRYTNQDKAWQDWAMPYIVQRGFGLFYFALNPDSEDTGGLVPRDWSEPAEGSTEAQKLEALGVLPSTDVFAVCPACADTVNASAPVSSSSSGGSVAGPVLIGLAFAVVVVLAVYYAVNEVRGRDETRDGEETKTKKRCTKAPSAKAGSKGAKYENVSAEQDEEEGQGERASTSGSAKRQQKMGKAGRMPKAGGGGAPKGGATPAKARASTRARPPPDDFGIINVVGLEQAVTCSSRRAATEAAPAASDDEDDANMAISFLPCNAKPAATAAAADASDDDAAVSFVSCTKKLASVKPTASAAGADASDDDDAVPFVSCTKKLASSKNADRAPPPKLPPPQAAAPPSRFKCAGGGGTGGVYLD